MVVMVVRTTRDGFAEVLELLERNSNLKRKFRSKHQRLITVQGDEALITSLLKDDARVTGFYVK